ncbi:MAG: hypothetical protein U1C96_01640 [Gallionella sp.]|nr:hypothetical protein [Gallionella sp.]
MEVQEAYKQKRTAQLHEWGAQIDLLEAKMKNASADAAVMRAEELQELRAKQLAASKKVKEFGAASGEAWEQIKVTADTIWDDLKAGIADAHAKFK